MTFLILDIVLVLIQLFHKDKLLNFNLKENTCYGTVGNWMQLKCFLILCIAFLIALKKIKINKWLLSGLVVFILTYFFKHNVFHNFLMCRGPVWLKTISLSSDHPFLGYGIGTFKFLFPGFQGQDIYALEGIWRHAHNFWVQLLFETGYIGLFIALLGMFVLVYKLLKNGLWHLLLGLSLVSYSLMFHFPDRQSSTVLILVAFFAYTVKELRCQRNLK
jgi:O-antigen ligase